MLNDRAAECIMRQIPHLRMRSCISDSAASAVSASMPAGDAGGQVMCIQCDQHRVRVEPMQATSPDRTVLASTGHTHSRKYRSRSPGACPQPESPAAGGSVVEEPRTARRTVFVATVPGPSGSIRRTVSSSALVRTKFSRAFASATAFSQAVGRIAWQRPQARAPLGNGRKPMEIGHGFLVAASAA